MKKIIIIIAITIFLLPSYVFAWDSYPPTPSGANQYQVILTTIYGVRLDTTDKPLKLDEVTFVNRKRYELVDNEWIFESEVNYELDLSGYEILQSNYDIYKKDGTVFFSAPKNPLAEGVNLENLMNHLPVGLIPFLIGLWIIYLGFSKAWQFLLTQLRKA